MNVVVSGDHPLVEEMAQLNRSAGHDTQAYHDGELPATPWDIIVDLHHAPQAKWSVLQRLSPVTSESTLILSLALTTTVTEIATWVAHPERVVGFGLISPVTAPGLVELAAGLHREDRVLQQAMSYWQSIKLEPVVVREGPGLVRARTLCCLINEAASALAEGVASPADIDTAMRLGTNYPYGPLEWADQMGLDNVLAILEGIFGEYGEDRYRPTPLLKRMVVAGRLGKGAGHGFYAYSAGGERLEP